VYHDIPPFADWDDCDKVNKYQIIPDRIFAMNLIHDQEIDEADEDAIVQQVVSLDQGRCFFLERHEDTRENIHDMESDCGKKPDQGWRI